MVVATALLVVRMYDMVGIAEARLDTARAVTRAILRDVGVDMIWRECSRHQSCGETLNRSELIVRIANATPASERTSLGYSLVDPEQQAGTLATIFADRVIALAAAADFDAGRLLGRTIAHELGHILLGTTDHRTIGLMRGHWTSAELVKDARHDWTLTRSDGVLMRRAVSARAGGLSPIWAERQGDPHDRHAAQRQ